MTETSAMESQREGLRAAFELARGSFSLRAHLSAPPGITALLGPSGAGKSLTLQAIAGLADIQRGAIHLNERALAEAERGLALAPRLRRVGYVPQSYALFPHLSVGANIAYGLPQRHDRAAAQKRVAELLRLVRLPGYEARAPRQLSGGEAQRVALARALAAGPEALLLDEPFSALDAPTRAAVRDDLREIALEAGLPTLLVTHDLGEALALASRLVVLVAGRVIAEGAAADVTTRPATALAARVLGWGAALDLARRERVAGGVCVTLAGCGQSLLIPGADCAEQALAAPSAPARLALRPERLRIARADEESERTDGAGQALRGVICSVTEAGPLWSARIALRKPDGPGGATLSAPCSAREWLALGLARGDAVTLWPLAGAARLVAVDDVVEAGAEADGEATR
ncbi:MAG TPA: ABC transporter ATP-binding protein [Ktedonobacterales bacterium]|nr:ABC transporter ATP-binding protein [Ktedonobacterales bacterium]